MKHFLFVFLLLTYSTSILTSTVPDDCLKYYWDGPLPIGSENPFFMNEDSVMIDSCETSETYLRLFVDGPYQLQLDYNIIPRSDIYPADTIISYVIDDIDKKYTEAINAFKELESKYGEFKFQEVAPDRADSTAFIKRSLFIYFKSTKEILKTEIMLEELESVKSARCLAKYGVVTNVENLNVSSVKVYPNPTSSILKISKKDFVIDNIVKLYDITGTLIKEYTFLNEELTINITKFDKGCYFLKSGNNINKIIIQ